MLFQKNWSTQEIPYLDCSSRLAVTNVREVTDFTATTITEQDYDFDRNNRFISTCTHSNATNLISIRSDKPHELKVGDTVIISDVQSTTNTNAKQL